MSHLDSDQDVIEWSYEKIIIPYISNLKTGKVRNYYPDFYVEKKDGSKLLIEIKPSKKLTQAIIKKKISAAEQWCSDHGMTYKIITEIELKDMNIILL